MEEGAFYGFRVKFNFPVVGESLSEERSGQVVAKRREGRGERDRLRCYARNAHFSFNYDTQRENSQLEWMKERERESLM